MPLSDGWEECHSCGWFVGSSSGRPSAGCFCGSRRCCSGRRVLRGPYHSRRLPWRRPSLQHHPPEERPARQRQNPPVPRMRRQRQPELAALLPGPQQHQLRRQRRDRRRHRHQLRLRFQRQLRLRFQRQLQPRFQRRLQPRFQRRLQPRLQPRFQRRHQRRPPRFRPSATFSSS